MALDPQHSHATGAGDAAIPSTTEDTPPEVKPTAKSNGQQVWDAIVDLANQERHITRKSLCDATGLKAQIVDDHVERLILNDRLRRVGYGVLEVVEQFPSPRAISKTVLPGGLVKLEIGDDCMTLTPTEARSLGELFCAEVLFSSGMAAGSQVLARINDLSLQLKAPVRRETAAPSGEPPSRKRGRPAKTGFQDSGYQAGYQQNQPFRGS